MKCDSKSEEKNKLIPLQRSRQKEELAQSANTKATAVCVIRIRTIGSHNFAHGLYYLIKLIFVNYVGIFLTFDQFVRCSKSSCRISRPADPEALGLLKNSSLRPLFVAALAP
jgi:hypothetical protein